MVHNLHHSFTVQMEKTVVTISIWQKPCEHIVSWHEFLIAVAPICWEACPDHSLLILTFLCKYHAVAYTATLRLKHKLPASCVAHMVLLISYGREVSVLSEPHVYHCSWLFSILPGVFCNVVARKKKTHMPRMTVSHDTWSCASSLQEGFCYWVTVLSFWSGNGFESC